MNIATLMTRGKVQKEGSFLREQLEGGGSYEFVREGGCRAFRTKNKSKQGIWRRNRASTNAMDRSARRGLSEGHLID